MKKLIINILLFYILINYSTYSQVALWAEKIGGIEGEYLRSFHIDNNENLLIAGEFTSDTIYFNNGITINKSTDHAMFLAKYNQSGLCIWATSILGQQTNVINYINKVSSDTDGNIYISGYFGSKLVFNNGVTLDSVKGMDIFLAKFNSNGLCQWAEKISGNLNDYSANLSISNTGKIYISGNYLSNVLNFNNGKTLNGNGVNSDCFIAVYDNNGICQSVSKIAGNRGDFINDIVIDKNENVYLTGISTSDSILFNNGKKINYDPASSNNIFFVKYNSNLICQWSEKIFGFNDERINSMILDSSGNIYLAGYYKSDSLIFNNSKFLININDYDGFVAKYDNQGICIWVEEIGGDEADYVLDITIDERGNLFIVGDFESSSINLNNGFILFNQSNNSRDIFFLKYNSNQLCKFAENIFGLSSEFSSGIEFYKDNNVYISGFFNSSNLVLNNDVVITKTTGPNVDGFLAKYDVNPLHKPTLYTPPKNSTNYTINPTFKWERNVIAEYYQLQIATDSLFASLKKNFTNLSDTSITISEGASLDNDTKYYWRVRSYNDIDTSDWSLVWDFTTKPISPVPDSWAFIDYTGSNSTVIIPAGVKPSINFRTLKVGDAIGFFYNRNDSLICAGYELWTDENLAITVWGDNSQTNDKDGYEINEPYIIKLWDALDGKEYHAEYSVSSGEKFFTDNGITVISSLKNRTTITQNTYLKNGWNMISTYVTPINDSLEVIWQTLQDKLLIQKNNAGQVFIPSFGINTIGKWNLEHGYKVYMSSSDTLKITGMLIEAHNEPIILNTGWSIVSYLRNSAKDISECVTSLTDRSALLIAKNNAGQVYIPSYDINTIGNMLPGQGYQMYISAKDTLIYPANSVGKLSFGKLTPNPKYLEAKYSSTGSSSNLIIITNANEGNEFGIYNQKDELIGSGIVHQGKAAITIWGDNEQTDEIDGALINEELRLKHYNAKNGHLQEIDLQLNNQQGVLIGSSLRYINDGISFSKVEIKDIQEELFLEINPNPATSSFEISYQFGNTNNCSIVIYNNNGLKIDEITNLTDNKYIYNSNKLSSGIYTVILNCDEQVLMRKLVIAK